MYYYLSLLVLFLAVIPLTNGRNYSSPSGIPHIHHPRQSRPPPTVTPPIPVPGTPHIHPPKPPVPISVPGVPHIHHPSPPLFQPPIVTPPIPVPGTPQIHPPRPPVPIPVPGVPHIHPPRQSRPPPNM